MQRGKHLKKTQHSDQWASENYKHLIRVSDPKGRSKFAARKASCVYLKYLVYNLTKLVCFCQQPRLSEWFGIVTHMKTSFKNNSFWLLWSLQHVKIFSVKVIFKINFPYSDVEAGRSQLEAKPEETEICHFFWSCLLYIFSVEEDGGNARSKRFFWYETFSCTVSATF